MKEMHKKNELKAVIAIAVALVFILPTSAMFANDITLQVTKVRFEPPSQTVEKGETFTASYYIEPTDWIMGANFVTISFDPTLLEVNSPVAKGGFFGGNEIMFKGGDIDNGAGTISDGFALVLVGDAVNVAGSVFVITFTAKDKLGTSDLTMSGVSVKNNMGVSIPITVESGSVTVGETVMLTIDVDGSGTTVPAPGSHIYMPDTIVDLEAIPNLDWSFDHWTGDVADPNSAVTNITMNDNKSVTAHFTEDCYALTVFTVGNGVVDVDPDKECYIYGESVNLTAVADPDWIFDEWSGDLSGSENPETIIMDGDKYVTATFTKEDTTPPVTNHSFDGTIGENNWYVSDVTVTLTATDDSSGVEFTYYKIDSGGWQEYNDEFTITDDDMHTLYYYSVDFAGNVEDTNDADFKIDQTPPAITLAAEKVSFGTYNLVATVLDVTSGVAYVEFYVNNVLVGTVTTAPYEYEISGCSQGDTATSTVYDNAGNSKVSNEVMPQGHSQSQSAMQDAYSIRSF